jgi:hypothetical protein
VRQVDVDLDGMCNRVIPIKNGARIATTWCDGIDNCEFVYNPLQVCAAFPSMLSGGCPLSHPR